jgi:hypothetical protein
VLSRDRLRDKLREFCDTQYTSFRGFPPTKADARKEWAAAFDDYISVAEEDILLPPSSSHPSMLMSNVKTKFEQDLGLDAAPAADAAEDFAGAWEAAIGSITAGAMATDTTGTTYTFVSFTNVAAKRATLKDTLEALFKKPAAQALPRLTAIADAFHAATDGLQFSSSMTVVGPPPVTSTTTIGLR